MEIFYVENKPVLSVEWEVTRGKTSVKEDFSQAAIWAFLTSRGGQHWTYSPDGVRQIDNGMRALSVTVNEAGNIAFTIPTESLDIGIYGVKLIWVKDGVGAQSLNELLSCNKRCMSEVFDLFGISASQYADTNPNGNIKFSIKSSAATYGYDGLSAYERAVMLGKTNVSESEWYERFATKEDLASAQAENPYKHGAGPRSVLLKSSGSQANGALSYAGGLGSKANADYSTTDGYLCEANAPFSRTGGALSNTEGTASTAYGYGLETKNWGEAAFGRYNASSHDSRKSGRTSFSIGCGSDEDNRRNAFEVREDGCVYVLLDGQSVNLQQFLMQVQDIVAYLNEESETTVITENDAEAIVGYGDTDPFEGMIALPPSEGGSYYDGSIGSWAGFPVQ